MAKTLSGLTPRQEQLQQERIFRRAERRMRKPVAREIRRAMISFAEAEGSPGAQASALEQHRENMKEIFRDEYRWIFERVGSRVMDGMEKSHPMLFERKFLDAFEAAAAEWIRNRVADKVTPIVGTTKKQAISIIRRATSEAWAEGLSVDALAGKVMSEITQRGGEISRWRSAVISRTETHNVAQAAGHAAEKSTGLTLKKEWVAASDERTRPAHANADGQIVGHEEMYNVGGYDAMYPGDASLPADQSINCRCASVAVVED